MKKFHLTQYMNGDILLRTNTKNGQLSNLWIEQMIILEFIDDAIPPDIEIKQKNQINLQKEFLLPLGIFQAHESKYFLFVEEATLVAQIIDQKYFHIDQVTFLPIQQQEKSKKSKYNKRIIKGLKALLETDFYFSYNTDITLTMQRSFQMDPPNEIFIWNFSLLKTFYDQKISELWIHHIIQGFINQISPQLNNESLRIILISRRSRHQGGTRFNSRGIDDDGNVANAVETEQIFIFRSFIFSHVIIRGSVPVFWLQEGVGHSIKLMRSLELTNPSFIKHFETLKNQYGYIYCINLIGNNKNEKTLNDAFQYLLAHNKFDFVQYQQFDMYGQCQGKYFKMNPQIRLLENDVNNFSYFCLNSNTSKVILSQNGVFRINCIDCVDRTNLYMSRLFFLVLEQGLKISGFNFKDSAFIYASNDPLYIMDEVKKQSSDFSQQFMELWAKNGDQISQIYSGSGNIQLSNIMIAATTSGVTRQGKNTLLGKVYHKVASLERLYNSTFEDKIKSELYSILTNGIKNLDKTDLQIQMEDCSEKYCSYQKIKIDILSWNLAGVKIDNIDIKNDLMFEGVQDSDLVVIGLQEMIPLNTQNVVILNAEKQVEKEWTKNFQQILNKFGQFSFVQSCSLVGLYLCVFAKANILNRISRMDFDAIKTGFQGALGNKGGLLIRFLIDDSQIVLTNCHLKSGAKSQSQRLEQLEEINQKAFKEQIVGKDRSLSLDDAEYIFLFGDLNFKMDMSFNDAMIVIDNYRKIGDSLQAEKLLHQMIQRDDLNKWKNKSSYLSQFVECGITFLPTYPYELGTNNFETKKCKTPGWCDRILVWSKKDLIVSQQKYTSYERKESDHRPVRATYVIEVKTIDNALYQQTQTEFLKVMKHEQPKKKKEEKKGQNFGNRFNDMIQNLKK